MLQINTPIQFEMPSVLRQIGADHSSAEALGSGNVGGYQSLPPEPWPGQSVGVRAPTRFETPLSASEIAVGLTHGVIQG